MLKRSRQCCQRNLLFFYNFKNHIMGCSPGKLRLIPGEHPLHSSLDYIVQPITEEYVLPPLYTDRAMMLPVDHGNDNIGSGFTG